MKCYILWNLKISINKGLDIRVCRELRELENTIVVGSLNVWVYFIAVVTEGYLFFLTC